MAPHFFCPWRLPICDHEFARKAGMETSLKSRWSKYLLAAGAALIHGVCTSQTQAPEHESAPADAAQASPAGAQGPDGKAPPSRRSRSRASISCSTASTGASAAPPTTT